jgi:phage terminase Nu1 subunit (DNA packaging protein)
VKAEATQKELAAMIKRSARQVHNLTEQGVFARVASKERPGQLVYPMPDSLHAFIDYQIGLQVEELQGTDAKEADRRKSVADAELKEMKVAQMRRDLAAVDEHRREITRVLRRVREAIDVFPGKHAPKLPGDAPMSERVAALRKIARELMDDLRRAGYADDGEEEDDAAA